jgi:dipeptidyl aminopeptidase/acylaminoacyl peptidase
MTPAPEDVVTQLLDLRTWCAFDVDEEGRVLAGSDELGTVQLVEIAPDGGRTALTALPGRCSGRYVPGRRQVVVEHDAGGDELMQLSLLEVGELPPSPVGLDGLVPLVSDPAHLHVLEDVTAEAVVYRTNRRNGVDMDVVVHDLARHVETVVYDAGGYVGEAVVSHDARACAVTRLSLRPNSTEVTVARAGAEPVPLTDADELALHSQVGWSADDGAILMSSNHGREFAAVVRVDVASSAWTTVVEDADHDLACWVSPDGHALVVGTLVDGAMSLALHGADGTRRCRVDLPGDGVPTVVWAADGSGFVVTVVTPTDPGSVHRVDARTGEVTVVVDARDGIPEAVRDLLVEPTSHRVPTPDGEQVPCFVYAPSERVAGSGAVGDPPLAGASVLHVHGGPEGAASRVFNPVVQSLVARGFTVLVPNVRGSVGYGKRWYSLDDVELRLDSVADLAALHDWLPSLGLDAERSALWGGSYGGYMVLAGVAMQPGLWAAGVDIVGMSSLVTFLENTSDYRRRYREREYGSLEHDRVFLEKASPITYLDDIRAPLFVIHGANDPRVPLSEAEQLEAALRRSGVECELRVYHDEGHGLAKRANRQDAYPAAIDFLARHLSTT